MAQDDGRTKAAHDFLTALPHVKALGGRLIVEGGVGLGGSGEGSSETGHWKIP